MGMINTEYLEDAEAEIALVADTHFMGAQMSGGGEFPSRARQSERGALGLRLLAEDDVDLKLHLGDLVQEYPGMAGFEASFAKACALLDAVGPVYLVAGNHDVGDKPDGTMPTHPVDAMSLQGFEAKVGASWRELEAGPCRVLLINSQIMNTGMEAEATQEAWIEAALERNRGRRVLLFFHLPLYLWDGSEPALGHYDVLGEPARSRLLKWIKDYGVELAGGAHVHFAFFDRIGDCRYFQFASSSFTRPGFGQLFPGPSAEEQGRNDAAKLGVYRLRVLPDRIDVHFIRTFGDPDRFKELGGQGYQYLLTRTSAGLANSPLGVSLTQPVTNEAAIPVVFPSVIRHRVRNDYPLLLLQEMGVRHLRIPQSDFVDPLQKARLEYLIREGLRYDLTGFDVEAMVALLKTPLMRDHLPSAVEWQLEGASIPEAATLRRWCEALTPHGVSLSLCPVVPRVTVAGKQHPRTRIGYDPCDLAELIAFTEEEGIFPDRALVRVPGGVSALAEFAEICGVQGFGKFGIDLALTLDSTDDAKNLQCGVEGLLAAMRRPGTRLFLDPLQDLDRTMDVTHGLLDTRCNPRPLFQVLRNLNTLFFAGERQTPSDVALSWEGIYRLWMGRDLIWIALGASGARLQELLEEAGPAQSAELVDLDRSLCCKGSLDTIQKVAARRTDPANCFLRITHSRTGK